MATGFNGRAFEAADLLAKVSELIIPWIQAADDETSAHVSGRPLDQSCIVQYQPATKLEELMALSLPNDGLGKDGLLKSTESILKHSVNTFSPGFLDKLYASTNPPGLAAEMLLSSLNTNAHVYRVSPALTLIERRTTTELARLFGLTGRYAGGVSQPGGSAANLTSLVVARNTIFPDMKRYGLFGREGQTIRPVLFVSSRAHYSFEKAAQVCGLGSAAAISVPSDAQGRLLPAELERMIIEARDRGQAPFYVAATAGTTVVGAFDPLQDIATIAKRYGLWLHVDAAWGGSFVFSDILRRGRLEGTELADSIAYNPHKMLGVPMPCSFLLVRDLRELRASNSLPAGYLFHDAGDAQETSGQESSNKPLNVNLASSSASSLSIQDASDSASATTSNKQNSSSNPTPEVDSEVDPPPSSLVDEWNHPTDLGDLTLQCGRRGDSLKFFLSWQYYGTRGFGSQVENAYAVASSFVEKVQTVYGNNIRVVSPLPLPCLQVCFYYAPGGRLVYEPPGTDSVRPERKDGEMTVPDQVSRMRAQQQDVPHGKIGKLNSSVTRAIADDLIQRGLLVDYAPAIEAGQPDWCGDFFRLVVNVQTRKETLSRLIDEILVAGRDVMKRKDFVDSTLHR